MGEQAVNHSKSAQAEADPQPLALEDFLRALSALRRQCSLYGSDHQNTARMVEDLVKIAKIFVECFGSSTIVPTEEAVIVNDRWYQAANNSRDLFERLRSRGAMAFTLVGEPDADQLLEFVLYLNAEPRDVRQAGGSNAYLRKHAVTKVVATDTVYVSEDETVETIEVINGEPAIDRAVAAVVGWLMKQDEEDDTPRVRVVEILAKPDAAAKLIREAVTKLHVAGKGKKPSELASQVIHELKDLASANHEEWDNATPQIRKAISKLPPEMRPSLGGFTDILDIAIDDGITPLRPAADAAEVEKAVNEFLEDAVVRKSDDLDMDRALVEKIFGAVPSGLLSNWKVELQPKSTLQVSGRTFAMLLSWETNSAEHGQIARSLAALVPRMLGMSEVGMALEAAASLVDEAGNTSLAPWRGINARSALQTVDPAVMRKLIEHALKFPDQHIQDAARAIVEMLPSIALEVIERLECGSSDEFMDSLRTGIEKAGRAAASVLSRMLTHGSLATKWIAIETLTYLGTDWALQEIASGLMNANPFFLARALDVVSQIRSPLIAKLCTDNLSHKSVAVRCAALRGLGTSSDETAIPILLRTATRRAFRQYHVDEQVAAIQALGKLGGYELIKTLEGIAVSRSLFWRSKYELVRTAATMAADEIRDRYASAPEMAA